MSLTFASQCDEELQDFLCNRREMKNVFNSLIRDYLC